MKSHLALNNYDLHPPKGPVMLLEANSHAMQRYVALFENGAMLDNARHAEEVRIPDQ